MPGLLVPGCLADGCGRGASRRSCPGWWWPCRGCSGLGCSGPGCSGRGWPGGGAAGTTTVALPDAVPSGPGLPDPGLPCPAPRCRVRGPVGSGRPCVSRGRRGDVSGPSGGCRRSGRPGDGGPAAHPVCGHLMCARRGFARRGFARRGFARRLGADGVRGDGPTPRHCGCGSRRRSVAAVHAGVPRRRRYRRGPEPDAAAASRRGAVPTRGGHAAVGAGHRRASRPVPVHGSRGRTAGNAVHPGSPGVRGATGRHRRSAAGVRRRGGVPRHHSAGSAVGARRRGGTPRVVFLLRRLGGVRPDLGYWDLGYWDLCDSSAGRA